MNLFNQFDLLLLNQGIEGKFWHFCALLYHTSLTGYPCPQMVQNIGCHIYGETTCILNDIQTLCFDNAHCQSVIFDLILDINLQSSRNMPDMPDMSGRVLLMSGRGL